MDNESTCTGVATNLSPRLWLFIAGMLVTTMGSQYASYSQLSEKLAENTTVLAVMGERVSNLTKRLELRMSDRFTGTQAKILMERFTRIERRISETELALQRRSHGQ